MANRGHKIVKSSSKNANDQSPRSLKYYLSSKNYHLNIGRFATKAYVQIKEFLAKEIPLPSMATGAGGTSRNGIETDADSYKEPKTQIDNESLLIDDRDKSNKKSTVEEIKQLTKRSNEVLCSARTVFPFSLFTDHVLLDRTKLTITKRDFFMSSQVISIRIEDILNVSADYGPFLGSISVAIRIMNSDDHVTISNLPRNDAIHLKHIIQGYVIALHNKIDVAHLDRKELIETLTDLGHDLNRP